MGQQHLPSRHDDQLVALGRVLEILREEENADVLIETTLHYLQAEFNYHLIWIGLYDRLEHRFLGKGGIALTEDTAFLKQRFNLQPGDLLEQVVIQQRSVAVPDLQQELRAGEWRRVAEDLGIQGTILCPLRCQDRCFGVTLLGSHQWGISQRPAEKAHLSLLLGGLAAALHKIEVQWQHSAIKHPERPLFQVLDELTQVPTVGLRLDKLVSMTQDFIAPTCTNLYWYSPERRYFWHRIGSRHSLRQVGGLKRSIAGLTVTEANDFYQALAAGQLVAIGMGRSLLTSDSTERLLARLQTRSLLAAPIQVQGELLGFLSVEDNQARIWEETERKYISATAQLVALVVGSEEIEATLEVTSKDTHFAAEIAQAIAHSHTVEGALNDCGESLCKHLKAEYFLILHPDERGQFHPLLSLHPPNRRPLTTALPPPEPENQPWLGQPMAVVTIEDLEDNWRLGRWRESLNQLGMRSAILIPLRQSLLLGQMAETNHQPKQPDGSSVLIIGHGTPRTWNRTEQDLVSTVAQQIQLLLTLSNYSDRARLSFLAHQTLQAGLLTLSQAPLDLVRFERVWVDYLVTLLECPLVALISWTPQSNWATVATAVVKDPRFALPPDLALSVNNNSLIQDALATPHFLCRLVADLPASTRQWLTSPGIGQLLIIALRRGTTSAMGILIFADHEERKWPQHLFSSLESLIQQFTWFRYYRQRLSQQVREGEELKVLNWYKHRCLETLHQSVRESVSALLELDTQTRDQGVKPKFSHFPLLEMHRHQLIHQLDATLTVLTPVLLEEQWQLTTNLQPIPLASLLKRSLRRVEPLYNQRQLVIQVHNLDKLNIYGDRLKLECILFELLLTACLPPSPGTWVHLWCCPIRSHSTATVQSTSPHPLLELLITESGSLDDCLQTLTSSPPESLHSLNLKICQQILRSWGGDLQFYRLEANGYLIRLQLRLEM